MPETLTKRLRALLNELRTDVREIEGVGLVSAEGLVIDMIIPGEWSTKGIDEEMTAAIVSGLVGISETSSNRFQKGLLHRITIKCMGGFITALKVTEEAYLFAITNENVNLGMFYLILNKTSKAMADMLLS